MTNELFKLIPEFRTNPGRLLICATNFIRALDGAFLRLGRFDAVVPIGLPDAAARAAVWAPEEPASDALTTECRTVAVVVGDDGSAQPVEPLVLRTE